jgi:hypothetical protein
VLLSGCTPQSHPTASSPAPTPASSAAPVVAENRLPGTTSWRQQVSEIAIAGYADAASVNVGQRIRFAVSTTSSQYRLDIYRLGWYGGAGARLMRSVPALRGVDQGTWAPRTYGLRNCPTCIVDHSLGLIDAGWRADYQLRIPRSWLSGNYLALLSTPSGDHAYIYFLVREDSRASDILVVMPVNTYQAYNVWGGVSLYIAHPLPGGASAPRSYAVSFNRPYAVNVLDPAHVTRDNDFAVTAFLEQHGYDVTYATSVDLERDPSLLLHHRLFLSIGHDEYWSHQMRLEVEKARDSGTNLIFLGGNDVQWQVRYQPDAAGHPARTMVCYKDAGLDPVATTDPSMATDEFQQPPVNQPQNALTGALYRSSGYLNSQPWTVGDDAPVWLLAGTGLQPGDSVPNLVRGECDRAARNGSQPSYLIIVGRSAAPAACTTVFYRAASGAEVFNAADEGWGYLIDEPRVARMTTNLLDRLTALR